MSSSTRSRRDRRAARLAAVAVAVCAVQWVTMTGAEAAPLTVAAVLPPVAGRVSLVVEVGPGVAPQSASVAVAGESQQATLTPVISDQLSTVLVVDVSESGAGALPGWLSGAARFALEAPAAARSAVVADTTPPVVVARLQTGPGETVRALSYLRAHGKRKTSQALTLATRQLPAAPAGPRVVVLYTTAADAGGESSAAVARRLANAHAILVVVSPASEAPYWADVARATGGFLAPTGTRSAGPALDQVGTLLRSRYLVTIPAPRQLPAPASVRVETGAVTLSADAVVPAEATAADDESGSGDERPDWWRNGVLWLVVLVSTLTLFLGGALLLAARQRNSF
jgi:hypothetical protein